MEDIYFFSIFFLWTKIKTKTASGKLIVNDFIAELLGSKFLGLGSETSGAGISFSKLGSNFIHLEGLI